MSWAKWIVAAVACGLGVLALLGMSWVHADWTTGNRVLHLAMAVALGTAGYLCLRRAAA